MFVPNAMSSTVYPPVLKLNVSGRIFYIKTSLILSDNRPLANMFKHDSGYYEKPYVMEDGSYYIEAHPDCFEAVLNFYRYGCLTQPPNVPEDLFVSQAIYWGILTGDAFVGSDEEKLNQRLSTLGWPASELPHNDKDGIYTCAITIGPGETGQLPPSAFMICAIDASLPYTIKINGTLLADGIVDGGVTIRGPLEEPIIPVWMKDGFPWSVKDLVKKKTSSVHFISEEPQTIIIKYSTKVEDQLSYWANWVQSRTQTSDLYTVTPAMIDVVKQLEGNKAHDLEVFYRDEFGWTSD